MTLQEFNRADTDVARLALLRCCGSKRWVEQILAGRPFDDFEALLSTAQSTWWALGPSDWLEAFSVHPKIGDKKLSDWSSQEQDGVDSASNQVLERLATGNEEYERRFGWIFLVNATGKTAPEILDLLNARLKNGKTQELHAAAGEQAKITKLRLNKLLTV
ncbi:MAG: 2-oxo-4-hydroxy-4-carboxy-5-ureidoimidazoline decarboxylase [Bryobacteraceae bacterium]